jgi:YVTN family beta-propeller protein
VHGIALALDLNKGFTSNGKEDSVTVFDLKTLAVTAKAGITGQNPDAILYDAFSHLVFTFNGKSANATVIDAKLNKVVATIALDGKPEFPANDGTGNLYVNIEDKNSISVINTKTLKVEKTWPIAPGEEPTGLAIDTENHRLFAVCHNKMMVIVDTQTGKVLSSLPIGERVDGVVYDPVKKRAYSSNGDGTMTVVQEVNKDSFKVTENVTTQKGARTIALAAKTHHLYLPTAEFVPSPDSTQKRPNVKPNSFVVLDIAPVQ